MSSLPIPVMLESPYSGDIDLNIHYALHCMKDSYCRGEAPFLTHLLYTRIPSGEHVSDDDVNNRTKGREYALQCAQVWRRLCQETVAYTDLGISPGMQRAIDEALANGQAVEYRTLPNWDQIQVSFQQGRNKEDDDKEIGPIIFSGSLSLSKSAFEKYYREPLLKAISEQRTIRVGCAKGCDEFVQDVCVQAGYSNVEVYVPSKAREVYVANPRDFKKIVVEGGFKPRDKAMWVGCKEIFTHLSQYAGAASGAAANLIGCSARAGKFGPDCMNLDGYLVVEELREFSSKFDPELQKLVLDAEDKKEQ